MEEPAAHDEVLRRLLDVQDACARSHPLGVAVGDDSAATVRVGVLENPVDDVGDGFEAAMGMPRRALGLTGCVLHLAHLIHHDEGIESAQIDAREGATHRETLTLETTRRGSDRHDRTVLERGIGLRHARQRERVVDGHGGHGLSLCGGTHSDAAELILMRRNSVCWLPVAERLDRRMAR